MTPQTRAEKILIRINPQIDWATELHEFVAAQIEEAERETARNPDGWYEKGYKTGYSVAKEQAAKIAGEPMNPDYESDDQIKIRGRIASQIRAMSPSVPSEGEKK